MWVTGPARAEVCGHGSCMGQGVIVGLARAEVCGHGCGMGRGVWSPARHRPRCGSPARHGLRCVVMGAAWAEVCERVVIGPHTG